jgi:hypothetical protein
VKNKTGETNTKSRKIKEVLKENNIQYGLGARESLCHIYFPIAKISTNEFCQRISA